MLATELPARLILFIGALSLLVVSGLVFWTTVPSLVLIHRHWLPATCTFAAPMKLEHVPSRGRGFWRVDAPVSMHDKVRGVSWPQVIAHRWPIAGDYQTPINVDQDEAAVFRWWTNIGGTGRVLSQPKAHWLSGTYGGEFEFTTPIGTVVPCWYLPQPRGAVRSNLHVKLSAELPPILYVAIYWLGVFLAFGVIFMHLLAAWNEYGTGCRVRC